MKNAAGPSRWEIAAGRAAYVAAIFREPPAGFAPIAVSQVLCRLVDRVTQRDILRPGFLADCVTRTDTGFKIAPAQQRAPQAQGESQAHIPFKAPPTAGLLRISTAAPPPHCLLNGKAVAFAPMTAGAQSKALAVERRLQAGEVALFSVIPTTGVTFTFEWVPTGLDGEKQEGAQRK